MTVKALAKLVQELEAIVLCANPLLSFTTVLAQATVHLPTYILLQIKLVNFVLLYALHAQCKVAIVLLAI